MSYCRFVESDVYMFWNENNVIECCGCCLNNDLNSTFFSTRTEAIKHLEAHKLAGDIVKESAIERLKQEIEQYGDEVK